MKAPTATDRFAALDQQRARLQRGGGPDKLAKQHRAGKLGARERLGLLFDPESFVEFGLWAHSASAQAAGKELPGDGVVTGKGEVDGRAVFAFSQDFTVGGGAVGALHAAKIVECLKDRPQVRRPGRGLQRRRAARGSRRASRPSPATGRSSSTTRCSRASSRRSPSSPGPAPAAPPTPPPSPTSSIMVEGTAHMFIAGPDVIRAATGEEITEEALGGATAHAAVAGNIHFAGARRPRGRRRSSRRSWATSRRTTSSRPPTTRSRRRWSTTATSTTWCPRTPASAYDVREVIRRLLDPGTFLELQRRLRAQHRRRLRPARRHGRSASWPTSRRSWPGRSTSTPPTRPRASCGPATSSTSRSSPSWTCPASCPGSPRSTAGSSATAPRCSSPTPRPPCPKLTVILRKAYGGAYLAMCSKDLGADSVLAWPTAEIAVMGPEGAARVLRKREIEKAQGPEAFLRGEGRRVPAAARQPLPRRRGASTWTTSSGRRGRGGCSSSGSASCGPSATCARRRSTATCRSEAKAMHPLLVALLAFAVVMGAMTFLTGGASSGRSAARRGRLAPAPAEAAAGRVTPELLAVLAAAAQRGPRHRRAPSTACTSTAGRSASTGRAPGGWTS